MRKAVKVCICLLNSTSSCEITDSKLVGEAEPIPFFDVDITKSQQWLYLKRYAIMLAGSTVLCWNMLYTTS